MDLLIAGIFAFIVFMVAVMGIPIGYYLKRDMKWQAAENKSFALWYSL